MNLFIIIHIVNLIKLFNINFIIFFKFIYSSIRSFHTFIINFILTLSKSSLNNFDYLMFVINKFFKIIIYIFDKNI